MAKSENKHPERIDLIAVEPIQYNRKLYESGDCLMVEADIAAPLIEAGAATRLADDLPETKGAEAKATEPAKPKPKAKNPDTKAPVDTAPKAVNTDAGSAG